MSTDSTQGAGAQAHYFDESGWCRHCNQYDCDIIGALEATVRDLRERLVVAEEALQETQSVLCDANERLHIVYTLDEARLVYGNPFAVISLEAAEIVNWYNRRIQPAANKVAEYYALTPDTSSEEAE